MSAFPEVLLGDPLCHEALTVFPLCTRSTGQLEYLLSDEAIGSGLVKVREVSEGGSVPDLVVDNSSDARVLFIEGEELVGAKQNRVLNTSVLIGARSQTPIPVSCVEQGRWAYKSKHFGSSGSNSPSRLRHALKQSVSRSLQAGRGHRSDQGKVWQEIARQHTALGVSSDTAAMADSYVAYKQRITDFLERLQYPEGAAGLAVAIGGRIVAVDLFDKPSTCRKAWRRLLTGFVLDALETPADSRPVQAAEVQQLLNCLTDLPWQQVKQVGEGEEYRVQAEEGPLASALTFQGSLVHGSVLISA